MFLLHRTNDAQGSQVGLPSAAPTILLGNADLLSRSPVPFRLRQPIRIPTCDIAETNAETITQDVSATVGFYLRPSIASIG